MEIYSYKRVREKNLRYNCKTNHGAILSHSQKVREVQMTLISIQTARVVSLVFVFLHLETLTDQCNAIKAKPKAFRSALSL